MYDVYLPNIAILFEIFSCFPNMCFLFDIWDCWSKLICYIPPPNQVLAWNPSYSCNQVVLIYHGRKKNKDCVWGWHDGSVCETFAAEPDDFNVILRTHIEWENLILEVSLWTPNMLCVVCIQHWPSKVVNKHTFLKGGSVQATVEEVEK